MHDVIVVGGGPTGLFLGCELKLAGLNPLVLEQRSTPDLADKAHGLLGLSVRLLDHRGLFERLGGRGAPGPAPAFYFGGLPLSLGALGPTNPLTMLQCNQAELERVLSERAAELGVELHRRHEWVSFTQTDDQVAVVVKGPDGAETQLTARYLVGCDGSRSAVRKQAGIGFPGISDEHVVDRTAMFGVTDRIRAIPNNRVFIEGVGEIPAHFHRTERGMFTVILRDPAHPWVNTAEWEPQPLGNSPGPGAPITLKEVEDSVSRVLGVHVALPPPPPDSPTLLRRLCGRNTRLADHHRAGRVFIAGDAAHVSYGPTLNLALGDAANLAWKLAAAVKGWAPGGLLDTYQTERHASGERIIMATKAETALEMPGPHVTAIRQLFGELIENPESARAIAALMSGDDVRYEEAGHPAVGRFVPSFELTTADGSKRRVAEVLRDARPVLLDFTGGESLARLASPWSDRVKRVAATASPAPAPALLIRPDGYVAWAGSDSSALETALNRWFGAPRAEK